MQKQNEKKYFKELYNEGFRYIARAAHGELVAFKEQPTKQINYFNSDGSKKEINHLLLPGIRFADGIIHIKNILK